MSKEKKIGEPQQYGYSEYEVQEILKWIKMLNKNEHVKNIFVHKSFVSTYEGTYKKLQYRSTNEKTNFFLYNGIHILVDLDILDVKISLYFFRDNTIDLIYKSGATSQLIDNYLLKTFPQTMLQKGWYKTWNKVIEIEKLKSKKVKLRNILFSFI